MRMTDIIQKKKQGEALSEEEIRFFVQGVTDGSIPEYQISAFCMAVCWQSMNDEEITILTDAMAASGDSIDLSEFAELSVDKHSTGGVGDKTTLILAPLVASCGAKVAKMSGRGLGHTGGTVDKLESIPGYRTEESVEQFLAQTRKVGVTVIGQSAELAPADKKLYALRDVTATVDSIPLIVSSVMSKKLAAGAKSIVLDVTVGSGAFMKDLSSARVLAEKMVAIGKACGRNMAALITNMDEPLGHAVGNALEVQEAIAVLKGQIRGDLREVVLALAAEMLALSFGITPEEGRKKAEKALDSGKAFEKFKEWIKAQGGDARYADEPERFVPAKYFRDVYAPEEAYIAAMNAEMIGNAAGLLGAGRMTAEDSIDPAAGIIICTKVGELAEEDEPIATLYADKEELLDAAEAEYLKAIRWSSTPVEAPKLVLDIIR